VPLKGIHLGAHQQTARRPMGLCNTSPAKKRDKIHPVKGGRPGHPNAPAPKREGPQRPTGKGLSIMTIRFLRKQVGPNGSSIEEWPRRGPRYVSAEGGGKRRLTSEPGQVSEGNVMNGAFHSHQSQSLYRFRLEYVRRRIYAGKNRRNEGGQNGQRGTTKRRFQKNGRPPPVEAVPPGKQKSPKGKELGQPLLYDSGVLPWVCPERTHTQNSKLETAG